MYGNPLAHDGTRVDLNSALAADLTVWLGLPAARAHFDPLALSPSDRVGPGPRRRADFEVSRALVAFADVGPASHSLSHSNEHAALLVAPRGWRLGVDLETDRPRDVLRLARFAFHERERAALEAAAPESRSQLFYTLWTLKESFAKALGLGLIDALRQCVFWSEEGSWRGQVPTNTAWGAAVFRPRPNLFLAVACIGAPDLPPLQQWEWPPKQRADWPLIASAGGLPGVATVGNNAPNGRHQP